MFRTGANQHGAGSTLRRMAICAATALTAMSAVSACSSGLSKSGAGSGGSGSGAMTIQFVNPLPKYPAWKQVGDCMRTEATKRGATYTETGPNGQAIDVNAMIQQLQQGISSHRSALVTFPASDGFSPVLKQAQKAGIVTTTVIGPGTKGSGADINVGVDWTKIGMLYVDAIAKRSGKQVVGLIAADQSGPGGQWMAGVRAAAAKTDNVTVAGAVYTGDDSSKALQQTQALLTAHPDITVIASHMGTVTQGAVAALTAKHLIGKVALVGNGHDNGGSAALQSGAAYALMFQNLCQAGTQAADSTIDRLQKKSTAASDGTPQDLFYGVEMALAGDYKSYLDKGWS